MQTYTDDIIISFLKNLFQVRYVEVVNNRIVRAGRERKKQQQQKKQTISRPQSKYLSAVSCNRDCNAYFCRVLPFTVNSETVENGDPAADFSSLMQGMKDAVLILSVTKQRWNDECSDLISLRVFDLDKHIVTRLHVTTRGLKYRQTVNFFRKSYSNQLEYSCKHYFVSDSKYY